MSAELVWALLFIAGVCGLLMLLAWLEPKHESPPRLQPLRRARVVNVPARAEAVGTAVPNEFDA